VRWSRSFLSQGPPIPTEPQGTGGKYEMSKTRTPDGATAAAIDERMSLMPTGMSDLFGMRGSAFVKLRIAEFHRPLRTFGAQAVPTPLSERTLGPCRQLRNLLHQRLNSYRAATRLGLQAVARLSAVGILTRRPLMFRRSCGRKISGHAPGVETPVYFRESLLYSHGPRGFS